MRKSVSFLIVVWFGSLPLLNSDLLGQFQLGPATPFDAANDFGVEGIFTIGPGGLEMVEERKLAGAAELRLTADLEPMALCLWQIERAAAGRE